MESDYYSTQPAPAETSPEALIAIASIMLIVAAASYAIGAVLMMLIFRKAGVASWKAWVPFYNTWKFFQIGGFHGALSLLVFVPVVNFAAIIIMYIAMYQIGLKLGKSGAFVLLGIFVAPAWYIWLGVDSSVWNDALGSPRRDTPDTPPAPTPPVPQAPSSTV